MNALMTEATSVMHLDSVLFLDVDGVLHPPNPKHAIQQFRTSCMELLRDVLNLTGASIVLSTTWRLHEESRAYLAMKLAEFDIPNFVSKTPSIAQFQRPKEILAWVSKYKPRTWVAVDDWPLHEGESESLTILLRGTAAHIPACYVCELARGLAYLAR